MNDTVNQAFKTWVAIMQLTKKYKKKEISDQIFFYFFKKRKLNIPCTKWCLPLLCWNSVLSTCCRTFFFSIEGIFITATPAVDKFFTRFVLGIIKISWKICSTIASSPWQWTNINIYRKIKFRKKRMILMANQVIEV